MIREKRQPLYCNVLALMRERVGSVGSSHQAEKDLVLFGGLLAGASDIQAPERLEIIRQVNEMANDLSATGDERNAKAYLASLVNELGIDIEPPSDRLGRTV